MSCPNMLFQFNSIWKGIITKSTFIWFQALMVRCKVFFIFASSISKNLWIKHLCNSITRVFQIGLDHAKLSLKLLWNNVRSNFLHSSGNIHHRKQTCFFKPLHLTLKFWGINTRYKHFFELIQMGNDVSTSKFIKPHFERSFKLLQQKIL